MPSQLGASPGLIAALPTLDLAKLQAADKEETQKLLANCQKYGFMHLDLRSDPEFVAEWDRVLDVMADYFKQPLEVKMLDSRGSDTLGYEGIGTSAGADLTRVDAYESLKVSRREYLSHCVQLTSPLKHEQDLFFSFMKKAHETVIMMLCRLSDACSLQGDQRFENFHQDSASNLSTLGILHYPEDNDESPLKGVGHNKHTDVGTLTFLLTQQWGLQILSPDSDSWSFVAPRPGHAVVNVGDSLRFLSGFKFASVVHRVLPLYEKQHEDRYSIAYFLRMADNTQLCDHNGKPWTARSWHDFKFNVFREPKRSMTTLTAGMESDDTLVDPNSTKDAPRGPLYTGPFPVLKT